MPRPDILDYVDPTRWLADWHQSWSTDPSAPTLTLLAERAAMSQGHLHNLLTGRRPLTPEQVPPLSRALALTRARRERLMRLTLGEAAVAPLPPTPSAERAPVLETGRARLATMIPPDAPRVRVTVMLQCFPVTVPLGTLPAGSSPHLPERRLTAPQAAATQESDMSESTPSPAPPEILDFLDYRVFLDRLVQHKRHTRPRLGVPWLAKHFRVTGGHMGNVLRGLRKLDPDRVAAGAARLGLDEDRARYLLLLVRFNDSSAAGQSLTAWAELNRLRAVHGRPLEMGVGSPLWSSWALPAVLELSTQPGWRDDPAWIAEVVCPPLTVREASDALAVLRAAGHLDGQGYGRADAPVIRSGEWISRELTTSFSEECLDIAGDSLGYGLEPWLFEELEVELPADDDALTNLVMDWQATVRSAVEHTPEAPHAPRAVHLLMVQAWATDDG